MHLNYATDPIEADFDLQFEPEVEPEFFHWMHEIDQELEAELGLDHNHLPDQPYQDWFADGFTTEEVVTLILAEMGGL